MADVNATYGIQLAVEGADTAEDSAKALEKLRDSIAEDTAALREMQATLRRLQGSTTTSKETFKQLRDAIAAKKLALAQGSQALVKMQGAFDGLGPSAKRAKAATDQLAFSTLKREVFGAERAFGGLHLSTLKAVPVQYAMAAAVAVVVAGLAAATVALFQYGAAAADARRSEALMIQAAGTHLWYAYGLEASKAADLTEAGAKVIQGAVDRVSTSTAISREKVAGFAEELLKARLSGQDLEKALKAVSTAASVGKEAGLVGAFASLKFMGMSVDKLADKIDEKFGGIVRRRMLSLDVQTMKLKEDWARLWKNVNVEPLLEAIHKVLSLFSDTTAAGYGLRTIFEALFPTDSAKTFGDIAAAVFKRLVIGALYLTIAILTVKNKFLDLKDWIDKTFKVDSVNAWRDAILDAVDAVAHLIPGLSQVLDLISIGSAASKAGKGLADGIRDGVDSGRGGVLAAIEGMGEASLAAFKHALGIHSPSRLFAEAGLQLPMGEAIGIRKGLPDVKAAVEDLGAASAPPKEDADAASASPAGRTAAVRSITVQVSAPISIDATGAKDQKSLLDDIEAKVADVFERAAQKLAAPLEAT